MTQRSYSILLLPLVLLLAGGLLGGHSANGQPLREVERVLVDDILTGMDGERRVQIYLRALTRYGEPVSDLEAADIVINDAGTRIDTEDIEVQTLSATGLGMTCVLAIDTSRTMRGEPFDRARSAALEFVRLLDPRDRIAIVTFSDEVLVPVSFSASRSEAIAQLELLETSPRSLSTVLNDGLHKSIELIRLGENLPRRAFVVVFSDGKDAGSLRTMGQVTEFGRSTRTQPPVLIFSIGYSRFGGDGLPILEKLSKDTGGDFVRAESPLDMTSFFNATRRQMKDSLVVTYPGDLDGKEHAVDISIEEVSASRTATYAKISRPILPWVIASCVLLVVVSAGFFVARGRSSGRLVFVNGPLAGRGSTLQRARTKIGALPDNDIVLASELVSRYHAAIIIKGRKAEIQDLDSRNGTFVNENKVLRSPIEPGDRIRLADVEAVFER